ncbi:MAG: hypothetical protein A2070_06285 [Bdellovibrionales bacterium GWC1_52_8]|nr:MAG: hypothetical protein A2Z97_05370 [Bdellovibrionales bacterium GWB1_52_6]OFZ05837.1 MAG: hypothetical protein A2X97_03275 [Bdellovibrionales bacterium GWA1_52_35]OFZ40665.1 MAG: hypothetical protein A2070_06285 [Bdellovibrionales bacterium GWC1_52_8]
MDKGLLVEQVLAKLKRELKIIQEAATAAHEAATHEQSKAEDQYDTRGLEASYLAGAQAGRAAELEKQVAYFKFLSLRKFSSEDSISPGALVEMTFEGRPSWYFLAAQGGGISVQVGNQTVQLITPASILGEALLGKRAGDQVEIESPRGTREYEIVVVT